MERSIDRTGYSSALFLHIVGALVYFVALGLEQASLMSMRGAARVEQVREWLGVYRWLPRLGPLSLALILISGFYMMLTTLGWMAWIIGALVAMVVIGVIGGVVGGPRVAAVGKVAAQESGPVSAALRQRLNDPLLSISMQVRTAIALGIVFLMVVKPDPAGTLITLVIAALVGAAAAFPGLRRMMLQRSE